MSLQLRRYVPVLALLILPQLVTAQDQPTESSPSPTRIPVRIVANRLVVRCDVSTKHRRVPVNLFVDYNNPCGLQLHNRVAGALKAESRSGKTTPITIHLSGLDITVEKREHGPEKVYNDVTKWYSRELGETPVTGTIGAELLKKYEVALDLRDGFIYLSQPAKREENPKAPEGYIQLPITIKSDIVWLPIRLPNGNPAVLGVGTTAYDTSISQDVCRQFKKPAGRVGTVRLGDFDISKFVAFRPQDVKYKHTDTVFGMAGLHLLKHFRIEVDRVNRVARIRQTAAAKFPQADLEFFQALAEDDLDPLFAYLKKHPKSRLSEEAAKKALDLCIETDAKEEQFVKALTWADSTCRVDLRTSQGFELMKQLREAGYKKLLVKAGELGLKSGRKDRYPNAIHRVHALMGEILLDLTQNRRAWKHLLSAAFGLPQDGMINLHLGRYYERQKRYRRATSRFVQAVIAAESGPQAMKGLARVFKAQGKASQISVDTVEKLIEGKVYGFGAATKFKPTKENSSNRVVLVEFFTNAHLKVPGRDAGAVGGALGNDGILTHYPRTHVVSLTYHLPVPELEPMTNRVALATARLYGIKRPVVQVINGTVTAPGAGNARDAEKIYNACRKRIAPELKAASSVTLSMKARIERGTVVGKLEVKGKLDEDATVHVVLAEKGVLYPGRSKVVIHRMVARAALTATPAGIQYKPSGGKMDVSFARKLDGITRANIKALEQLEQKGAGIAVRFGTQIDPRQVRIVAFVRNKATREVLQAIQVQPKQPKPAEKTAAK